GVRRAGWRVGERGGSADEGGHQPRDPAERGPRGFCQGGGVTSAEARRRVAIVGGGIAGLAAAYFLRDSGIAVTVLEGSPRIGGKLAVSDVAGIAGEAGAEAMLARRPEGTELVCSSGRADQVV